MIACLHYYLTDTVCGGWYLSMRLNYRLRIAVRHILDALRMPNRKAYMQCSVCIYKSVYNWITIEYCSRSMASNWLNFSIVRKEKAGKCNQFYVTRTPYGTAIRALKGLTKWIKVKLRNETKKKIIIIWLYTLTYKT